MRCPSGYQVEDEKSVVERRLRDRDQDAFGDSRLSQRDKRHQMNALILRLVHEGPDPAAIVERKAQAFEMQQRCGDHRRDRGHGLEHHDTMAVSTAKEGAGHRCARAHDAQRNSVGQGVRNVMSKQIRLVDEQHFRSRVGARLGISRLWVGRQGLSSCMTSLGIIGNNPSNYLRWLKLEGVVGHYYVTAEVHRQMCSMKS